MSEKWYLVTSRNKPLVPDMVLQAVEPNSVLTDNGGKVPIDAMISWGYKLIPIRPVPIAAGDGLLWSDDRIRHYAATYPQTWDAQGAIDVMYMLRDEYEQERKDKIFIPVELRGCLLSTIQKSREFLADMIERIEERLAGEGRLIHSIQKEIDGWKVELAEYDEVLKALMGEPNVQEKIPE